MGVVYVSDSEDDQILLTPEIASSPKSLEELSNYIETYLRLIREDLMRFMDGTWRFIVVSDHIEAQQFDADTEVWIKRFRVRGETS